MAEGWQKLKVTANFFKRLKPQSKAYRVYEDNLKISVNPTGLIRVDFIYKDQDRKQHLILLGKFKGTPEKEMLKHIVDEHARLKLALLNGAKAFWEAEGEKEWIRNHPRPSADTEFGPLPPKYQAEADAEKFRAIVKEYCDWFEDQGKASSDNERYLTKKLVEGVGKARGLGNLNPEQIEGKHIQRILDEIASKHPQSANHVKKMTSRLWRYMKRRGYVSHKGAVEDLDAKAPPPRDRLVTEAELKRLVKGIHPYYLAVIINPLRLVEHCRMNWDDIDDDLNATVVVKGGRKHIQPVTERYLALGRSTREEGGYLFTGRHGKGHILRTSLSNLGFDHAKAKKVEDFHNHDIRSAFGSWHEKNKTPFEIWDACLAHRKQGMRGVYGLYGYLDEKREAIEAWEDYIYSLKPTVIDPEG